MGPVFGVLGNLKAVDDIVFLAQQTHEDSRFSHVAFAPDKIRSIAKKATADPKRHSVLVAGAGLA